MSFKKIAIVALILASCGSADTDGSSSSGPKASGQQDVAATGTVAYSTPPSWTGEYDIDAAEGAGGTATIVQRGAGYAVNVEIGAPGCGGSVSGAAVDRGNTLLMTSAPVEGVADSVCRLTFDRTRPVGQLSASSGCMYHAGAACSFSGTFRRIGGGSGRSNGVDSTVPEVGPAAEWTDLAQSGGATGCTDSRGMSERTKAVAGRLGVRECSDEPVQQARVGSLAAWLVGDWLPADTPADYVGHFAFSFDGDGSVLLGEASGTWRYANDRVTMTLRNTDGFAGEPVGQPFTEVWPVRRIRDGIIEVSGQQYRKFERSGN